MKISLITPEHDPNNRKNLIELFECIKAQTYENWEWVLYLNGKCEENDICEEISNHNKVKVVKSYDNFYNIGEIKNKAFNLGTGEVLVELDHDDLITEDCLEKLNIAFQNKDIGFVYSDSAILNEKEEFIPFSELEGWSYRKFNWKGKELYAMRSFEPSSQSLSFIWYAPDHIRAWRSSVYKELGGHNKNLYVCDDHELCIKTYLHSRIKHIPEVLYIYRITGNNTWIQRNKEIQETTKELNNNYTEALAERDAHLKGLFTVNIGNSNKNCTHLNLEGNEIIQLPDNSVGVIYASDILQKFKNPIKIMKEMYRVLCHGGWSFIDVPSTDGRGAFQDPTHLSFWNENSFLYYTNSNFAQYIGNDSIRFQQYKKETIYPNEQSKELNILYTRIWLVAIKQDFPRFPGRLDI